METLSWLTHKYVFLSKNRRPLQFLSYVGAQILTQEQVLGEQRCSGAETRERRSHNFSLFALNEFEAVLKWLFLWVRSHIFLLALHP